MNARQLVYTHNNAYDSVLLLRHDGLVVSRWTVTPDVMQKFLDEDGTTLADWDEQALNAGLNPGDHRDYGTTLAVTDSDGRTNYNGFAQRIDFYRGRKDCPAQKGTTP